MYRKAGLLSCEQNKENSKIVQNYLNCFFHLHKTTYGFCCIGCKVLEKGGNTAAQDLREGEVNIAFKPYKESSYFDSSRYNFWQKAKEPFNNIFCFLCLQKVPQDIIF